MQFGLFSESGHRHNLIAASTYEEDLDEIVLADELGFREAWIAEPNHVRPNTITDANLLLGRLNPGYFLGGEFPLYPELAEKTVGQLAERLGLSPQEAANGIIEIANSNMVGALRLVSVQRGFDPREFMLVAFGGAGPVHANALARDLSISKVLIPMGPGVTTALGLLVSDIKHDYVRGYIRPTATLDFAHVNRLFEEMEGQGGKVLAAEGINGNAMRFTRYVDMRYVGQSYELMIESLAPYSEAEFVVGLQKYITDPEAVNYRPAEYVVVPAPWYRGRVQ